MTPGLVLMMGLPESGKSTYAAALFHTLKESAEGMSLRDLPEERDYLLTMERRWLALEPVGHSANPAPKSIALQLKDVDGSEFDVAMPDVNGEEFLDAWEHGTWTEEITPLVAFAGGVMLFVRANDIVQPELIEVGHARSSDSDGKAVAPWTPKLGTTQAMLCDLLEQMSETRGGQLPPIAVVVSAWDVVEEGLTPEGWLAWNLPLVDQWLSGSIPPVRFELFGISAQGGDLENEETRARLATLPRVGRPGGAHALTAPLRWLIEA